MDNSLLIKNGHIIDPANKINGILDLLIEEGKIKQISKDIKKEGIKTIDASNRYVLPGFIDMHVHLREPGQEYKETIATGTHAAARGGFTTILCMPNTEPPIDNENSAKLIYKKAGKEAFVNLFCAGCITIGRKGKELADMEGLKSAGCIALSDDGNFVADSGIMRRALEKSSKLNLRIISHSEDTSLSRGGQINEGPVSKRLGLKGIPHQAEEIAVYRDISLSGLTHIPIHIAHISAAGTVALIRNAKAKGIPVTCETAPHYFSLTDDCLKTPPDGNLKVNPPLRSSSDVEAIKEGIKDGTIDAIATDHAPHSVSEKNGSFVSAPPGIIGMETAISLSLNEFGLEKVLEKFTINPAHILNIPKGALSIGADADVTIIDINKNITVAASGFFSKSRNTPFNKWKLKGAVITTIVAGRIIYNE